MKKIFTFGFLIFSLLFLNANVNAQDCYYLNDNGICFSEREYEFFTKMYYDGYQSYMTQEDMDKFANIELNPDNVKTVTYEDNGSFVPGAYSLQYVYYETTAKKLQMSSTGGSYPTIVLSATWKGSPNVRSYDLIGTYLSGITLLGSPSSTITYSGGSVSPSATKNTGSGFGSSLLLPSSGSNIVVSTTFTVTSGGTVYGSYQHAKKLISLSDSQSFTTSYSGLGHVFYFSNTNIRAKYDAMGGVHMSV